MTKWLLWKHRDGEYSIINLEQVAFMRVNKNFIVFYTADGTTHELEIISPLDGEPQVDYLQVLNWDLNGERHCNQVKKPLEWWKLIGLIVGTWVATLAVFIIEFDWLQKAAVTAKEILLFGGLIALWSFTIKTIFKEVR